MEEMPRDGAAAPLVEASILNRLQVENFATASDLPSFCRSWLSLNCSTVRGCQAGAVFAIEGRQLKLTAVWPEPDDLAEFRKTLLPRLSAAAKAAHVEGSGVLLDNQVLAALGPSQAGTHCLAVPIQVERTIWGLAALEVAAADQASVRGILERLQWATGWFSWFQFRQEAAASGQKRWRLETALDLLASVLGHKRFQEAAIALVNELAPRFSCDRVSLGISRSNQIDLVAVSGATIVDRKMEILERVSAAMEEALDQGSTVSWPPSAETPENQRRVTRHHEVLCGSGGVPRTALTVLMTAEGEELGALTLERDQARPFTHEETEVIEATAELLGPMIDLQRREDRFIGAKVSESLANLARRLLGPGHTSYKVGAVMMAVSVLFFSVVSWEHRVGADSVTEAVVQRACTVPFEGFLREAPARAGDLVSEGDILAVMDDRELQQRRREIASRRAQFEGLYKRALGEKDAAQQRILSSQIQQVEAELALIDERIELTRIRSPLGGLIVAGDWSQELGSPLAQGVVLFEVARLDDFRLVLKVDESDIDELQPGQRGEVRLLSRPHETYPIRIVLVTPVSQVEEGSNVFRVEASFENPMPWLRPGMKGVAKVEVGSRLLIWIWTHRLADFFRLHLWL